MGCEVVMVREKYGVRLRYSLTAGFQANAENVYRSSCADPDCPPVGYPMLDSAMAA